MQSGKWVVVAEWPAVAQINFRDAVDRSLQNNDLLED